ncbi:hypothetical protein AO498_12875 [Algoriphagus sanaruensis]|uniref:Sensory/regulatory protein RpfC n=2 Tax=Algoriphagus sanaruensis TaxID=1727163 RepID=A0A142EQC8_9BACT|nr:hypothetical protein AO498_12875 [Algoriphagus sanaruensis]
MMAKKSTRPNLKLLTSLGIGLVVSVLGLGISFFFAIYRAQIDSRQEFLTQQTALASRGLEVELERFQTEVQSYFSYLNSLKTNQEGFDQSLNQSSRRLFNMFPQLIDTLWVKVGEETVSFSMTPRNDFIAETSSINFREDLRPDQYFIAEEKSEVQLIFSLNIQVFTKEFVSNFYLNPGGKKFLISHAELQDLNPGGVGTIELDESDFQRIVNDVEIGLKGTYQVSWKELNGPQVQGVLVQYPLSFDLVRGRSSLIFLIPTESLTSGIYSTYIFFFVGIVILLGLTVVFFLVSLFNNINSKKEIESNLQKISGLFDQQNLLLKELRGFVFFIDSAFKVSHVSEEFESITGLSIDQFIQTFSSKSHQSSLSQIKGKMEAAIKDQKQHVNLEFDFEKNQALKIRLRVFVKLMYLEGRLQGALGIATDITSQYLSQQKILANEVSLRNLIKSIPDSIIIYSNDGEILDLSLQGPDESRDMIRLSLGKNLQELVDIDQGKELWENFQKARKTGKIQTSTVFWKNNSGSPRHFEVRFFPLDENQMMSISKDITSQKIWEKGLVEAMEAADQASRAKSQFLANMSHEIRTPMNGLLGIIDLLENTPMNPIQKQYVDIIKNSGSSLLAIIRDILDYSKIESGSVEIQNELFNPSLELQSQVEILHALAKKKDIEVKVNASKETSELFVQSDRDKINQIILNLLSNAIKFTPDHGKVEAILEVEGIEDEMCQLIYRIKDSGIGIASENIEKLTEPFFQVESSNSRSFQGTGLGLAIAKRMVDLMGGEFEIQSEVGKGSVFSFSIWVKKEVAPKESIEKKKITWKEMKEMGTIFPLKILLVEDNELNLQLMRMMFEQLGFQFDVAKNGLEALEMVDAKSYDVVLMDVQMPLMNGLEATKKIRENPKNKNLVIIGLSANVFEDDQLRARAAGMDDYITKPIRLVIIAEKLEFYYLKLREEGNISA